MLEIEEARVVNSADDVSVAEIKTGNASLMAGHTIPSTAISTGIPVHKIKLGGSGVKNEALL